ncbi:MAG TPA: anion permease [Burkholderiales bacterium]|nr:anion permease [Burkholderiales bacterium]
MSVSGKIDLPATGASAPGLKIPWAAIAPVAVAVLIALFPAPEGLAQHAWYFFAIFVGVIVGLMFEPLPGGAIGLIGVTLVTVLSPYVFFGADQLAKPGFSAARAALAWALSGFSNATVWLIFGAFMFALGYEKTGLGRRIALLLVRAMGRKTLTLGYAVTIADTLLAPFTPSNTARSGGTIYPVIRNLPALYDSKPNDPSMRRIGSYLMWVALAATCVTSSLFLTGLAPNLLAVELVKKTAKVDLAWMDWFIAIAPAGILLLAATPLLAYWLYPPEVKEGAEVPAWAAKELEKMGPLSRREMLLGGLVVIALLLWIFGGNFMEATTAAIVVISLMLLLKVVTWDDITANKAAWNTLAWFATLVALADGLNRVGFIKWFADSVAAHMAGFSPLAALIALLLINFLSHYLFASVTAHVTAMIPVLLVVGSTVPDMNMATLSLLLCLQLGIMGVITPFATGPSPVYYGSGYLPSADYWRLGAIFGALFLVVFMVVSVPWVLAIR